nr:NADH dehydrogenase subunit 6 [Glottidia pyramidata]
MLGPVVQSFLVVLMLGWLSVMFLAPSTMMLGFSLLIMAILCCLWLAMVVQPWTALLLFLTLGGAVLVSFMFILALDSDPATGSKTWRWGHMYPIPFLLAGVVLGVRIPSDKGQSLWMSADTFTTPLFSSANFYFFTVLIICLVAGMVAVVKMVPSQMGALRRNPGR